MNVGALIPTDYGYYFNWGGTTDVTSTTIDLDWNSACPYWVSGTKAEDVKFSKYVPTSSSYWGGSGAADNKLQLDFSDDAARVHWGGTWRIPSYDEYSKLVSTTYTRKEWVANYNSTGVSGYIFRGLENTAYTDNSIFLPAAGYRTGTSLNSQGSDGYYWSLSLYPAYPRSGRRLHFNSGVAEAGDGQRRNGFSVRPVHD